MSWCTSSVGLQLLPFIDNIHFVSIPRFQRVPCLNHVIEHTQVVNGLIV